MAADLPQPGDPGQYFDPVFVQAALVQMLEGFMAELCQICQVQLLLLRQQRGGLQGLYFFRKLPEDIAFQPAQKKGAYPPSHRFLRHIGESFPVRKKSRKHRFVNGPKLLQMIFHRGSRECEPIAGGYRFDGLSGLGKMIFESLGFVQQKCMKGNFSVLGRIPPEQGIRRDNDIRLIRPGQRFLPVILCTVRHGRPDMRSETLQFVLPVIR